ncbi:MAG: aminodeoxychorismate/anthranilate synthase component II [Tomitella sp.]|nr:aminodeoxychorismate/anthranilate synthase component II [Tomitella sp.]
MRILVIDNYDSFVFNLVQYLGQLGADVEVWRNDDDRLSDLDAALAGFAGVLVSPGPGTPERAGESMRIVRRCGELRLPLLGVCLGHQAVGAAFGATVGRAPELLHGKTSVVEHDRSGVLADVPSPFTATRYHSLTLAPATIPDDLVVTARTASGVVMAVRHRDLPIDGVQFHPESVLSEGGHRMLATWLRSCGFEVADELVDRLEAEVDATAAGVVQRA